MDHVLEPELHVVAQIVEAELVVGPVSDVAQIGLFALRVVEFVNDAADAETEKTIDLAHPFGVAACQVVVDGDDVHAVAGESIEVHRKGCHQGLAFAGFHFGDHAAVEHHATHQLHVEVTLAERAFGRLANRCEGLDQEVVEFRPISELLPKALGAGTQLLIGHRLELRLDLVDRRDDRPKALYVTIIGGAEQPPG